MGSADGSVGDEPEELFSSPLQPPCRICGQVLPQHGTTEQVLFHTTEDLQSVAKISRDMGNEAEQNFKAGRLTCLN